MKRTILLSISILFLAGCESDNENELVKKRFHGKYELISSVSSDPVDLNRDGSLSTNLLDENPTIAEAKLEVRILDDGRHLLTDIWPVEYVSGRDGHVTDSISYQPGFTIQYFFPANAQFFQFSHNSKSIQLLEAFDDTWPCTIQRVESITIEEGDIVKFTALRKVYTLNGWTTIRIESRYIRYTSTT